MLPSIGLALSAALLSAAGVHAAPQAQWTPTPTPTGSAASATGSVKPGTSCNNSPSLCDRQYNKITYLGAHDSAFLRDESTDNSIAGNQYFNATDALSAGLRMLQVQVHDQNGALELCHTSCSILDAGSLQDFLSAIADWMAGNPNDVVTVLLVNSDSKPVDQFGQAFKNSGLAKYAYSPTSTEPTAQWPSLGAMIASNQRLVSFVTDVDPSATYPYIMSEFDHVFETSFEVTELSGFNCTLDRPSNLDSAATALSGNYLSLLNHFKYQGLTSTIQLPDPDNIDTVNSADDEQGSLGQHLQTCNQNYGQVPNFVLVDFWSEGNPLEAVDQTNGLTDVKGRSASDGSGDSSAPGLRAQSLGGHGALLAFVAAVLMLV